MDNYLENFLTTLTWYRNISNKLIEEIPSAYMHRRISSRSLTPACQLVDLGDFHLRVVSLITGKEKTLKRPIPETATPREMMQYIQRTQHVLETVLAEIPNKSRFRITWFDRMTFTFPGVLSFILAHEAMHHGELMSFIYDKNLPMPKAFTETWGMC